MFWELPEVSLLGTIRVFCSNAESRFAALFFQRYVRYFGSLHPAFEMSCDTEYLEKNSFWFFSETWSSSFWIVCNSFDDLRTNRPKNNGRSHRKKNTNFKKWRWVRLKNICSSSALLFSLVVNKKLVLRNSWDLSTRDNTCSLFKCRVTFWLRYFSNAMFGTLALYILRLRCLAIPNTWKKTAFDFFRKRGLRRFGLCAIVLMICVQTVRKIMGDLTERKTQTLKNDVEYV